jgi:pimeloyl-ACP methyl ester carboxylesterase
MPRVALGRISIDLWEEGEGRPILLLHGFPTNHLLWHQVVPALVAAGCRNLAPDLVGFAQSDAPDDVQIDMGSQAEWMLALLDRLQIQRVLLVAHDVGTAVAQIMVARAPERILGLMLIDGVYADRWGLEALESIRWFDPAGADSLYRILVRRMHRQWTTGVSEEVIRRLLAPYQGAVGGTRLIRAARSLDPRQTVAILDSLGRRPVRSRVLWGEKDPFLTVDEVARPLAALLGAELKVYPGGHFLPLERPAEIASEIIEFLGDLTARA